MGMGGFWTFFPLVLGRGAEAADFRLTALPLGFGGPGLFAAKKIF
jgi:hypothetical protein